MNFAHLPINSQFYLWRVAKHSFNIKKEKEKESWDTSQSSCAQAVSAKYAQIRYYILRIAHISIISRVQPGASPAAKYARDQVGELTYNMSPFKILLFKDFVELLYTVHQYKSLSSHAACHHSKFCFKKIYH